MTLEITEFPDLRLGACTPEARLTTQANRNPDRFWGFGGLLVLLLSLLPT